MNGFERRKEKKTEQIYAAAFQLFAKYGFQKVSVGEIAELARVSPATIYNYFGTKEQLYASLLLDWMDKQLAQYEELLQSERTFPEKTKAIMLLESDNLKMLTEAFSQVPSSEWSEFMHGVKGESGRKITAFFMKYVAMGKQEGYIRPEQSEEAAMRYFVMFQNELGRQWDGGAEEAAQLDDLLELFFYGLAGKR